jgi:hypothetical protein
LRRHPSCSCLLHRGAISSQPIDIANAPKDLVKAHTGSRSPILQLAFDIFPLHSCIHLKHKLITSHSIRHYLHVHLRAAK